MLKLFVVSFGTQLTVTLRGYCFFSRPTAVNLSDAAKKLKEVILDIAKAASDARSIFEVIKIVISLLKPLNLLFILGILLTFC